MKYFAYTLLLSASLFSADATVDTTSDTVGNTLRAAIATVNADTATATNTITITATGTTNLGSLLPLLQTNRSSAAKTVNITGPVGGLGTPTFTIECSATYQGFFATPDINEGTGTMTLNITNLNISNARHTGGAGAGGGAGLGGGLFIGEGVSATLTNVFFDTARTVGGPAQDENRGGGGMRGGAAGEFTNGAVAIPSPGTGGGGLGGSGGSVDVTHAASGGTGGGGLLGAGGGTIASMTGGSGGGGEGVNGTTGIPTGGAGGVGSTGGAGGEGGGITADGSDATGGTGGSGGSAEGGDGGNNGIAGSDGTLGGGGGGNGGAGGIFGGGGGGANSSGLYNGGAGGFGGGGGGAGGGAATTGGGGRGGFGGGGGSGGRSLVTRTGGDGGFGGGAGGGAVQGSAGFGGGDVGEDGLALGGAIFIQGATDTANKGSLTIVSGSFSNCQAGDGNTDAFGNDIYMHGNADLIFNNTSDITLENPIGGNQGDTASTGTFRKQGAGNLTLGAGTWDFDGTIQLDAGTLTVANGESTWGTSSSTFTFNGGTLASDDTTLTIPGTVTIGASGGTINVVNGNVTFSGAVSGPGGPTLTGACDLLFEGDVTYEGDTSIGDNCSVTNSPLTSNLSIGSNGTGTFIGKTGTFSGNTSGAGQLAFSGSSITVTGTLAHQGTTFLQNDSIIYINGDNSASSLTAVTLGATLRGTGSFNFLACGATGILFPGQSIGTMTAATHLQATGSTLKLEFDGTTSSKLSVTGTSTIQSGATLEVIALPDTYITGTQYTLIEAGTLSGSFDTFTITNESNLGGLTAALSQTGTSLFLTLSGGGSNDTISSCDKTTAYLNALAATGARSFQSDLLTYQNEQRLINWGAPCNAAPKGLRSFAVGDYTHGHVAKADHMIASTYRENGLMFGLEGPATDKWLVGALGGWSLNSLRAYDRCGKAHGYNYTAGAYAQYFGEKITWDGAFLYTHSRLHPQREAVSTEINDGKAIGYSLTGQMEMLYTLDWTRAHLRPLFSLQYSMTKIAGYTEHIQKTSQYLFSNHVLHTLDLSLGALFWYDWTFDGGYFRPLFRAAWGKNVLNDHTKVNMHQVVSPTNTATVIVQNPSFNHVSLSGGLNALFRNCLSVEALYEANFRFKGNYSQDVRAGLTWHYGGSKN